MDTSSFQIKVTNRNDFAIRDMYDGIPYVLGAMEQVNVPYEAACHIFGVRFVADGEAHSLEALRDPIFHHVVKRWGWNRAEVIKDRLHEKWFANIEFKLIALTLVEQAVGEDKNDLPEPRDVPRHIPVITKRGPGRPSKKIDEDDEVA